MAAKGFQPAANYFKYHAGSEKEFSTAQAVSEWRFTQYMSFRGVL